MKTRGLSTSRSRYVVLDPAYMVSILHTARGGVPLHGSWGEEGIGLTEVPEVELRRFGMGGNPGCGPVPPGVARHRTDEW